MIAGIIAQQAAMNAAPPAAGGIQFVGGKVVSAVGASLSFDFTGLTGGLATEPSVGDFFLISVGWARAGTSTPSLGTIPVGCDASPLFAVRGSDSIDASLAPYKGIYEAGSSTGGSANSPGGGSTNLVAIQVFRGVDAVTPMDVAPTAAVRSNGCDITLAAITPVTAGAVICCCAVSGSQSSSNTYFDPPTITDIFKVGRATTNDGSIIVGANYDWVSGAFSPGLFDFNGGDSLSSAASGSVALRPAA